MRSALPLRPAYKVRSQWGMRSLTLVSIRANPRGWNFRERQVPEPDASAILSLFESALIASARRESCQIGNAIAGT
jgi:hypothetical protein